MDLKALFTDHIDTLTAATADALSACHYDGLVVSSGAPFYVFEDDQTYSFRANHHFSHWCPVAVPNSLVHFRPGKKPKLYFYAPADYWHDSPDLGPEFWQESFEIECLSTPEEIWQKAQGLKNTAYQGPDVEKASSFGLEVSIQKSLQPRLNWARSFKTVYEEQMTVYATEKAARGHRAAETAFHNGASEREVHYRFLETVGDLEAEMPYGTIIAFDDKAAILHYTAKRSKGSGQVFLIDAGAKQFGYASDITRTYCKDGVSASFRDIVCGVETLQQEICAMIKPGVSFPDIHRLAHEKVADLLLEVGVLRGVRREEALDRGLTNAFFPHGIGHMLGLQVHDVAGKQSDAQGTPYRLGDIAGNPRYEFLRSHRVFAERHLFTVEPGVYFIPLLLDPLRHSQGKDALNWQLIDECIPFGGVRVEDNVIVTQTGVRNITREFLP